MGLKPKKPKITSVDANSEEQKRIQAEERLRRSLGKNSGTAANLLASKDIFGSSPAARTKLGGSSLFE